MEEKSPKFQIPIKGFFLNKKDHLGCCFNLLQKIWEVGGGGGQKKKEKKGKIGEEKAPNLGRGAHPPKRPQSQKSPKKFFLKKKKTSLLFFLIQ